MPSPQFARVLDLVAERRRVPLTVIGIGGHGGAGKSTLAAHLATQIPGTQIVATDSFWDGSGFDLDRLHREALAPLLNGRVAEFAQWDWAAKRAGATQRVVPEGIVVIEGVCALHRMFREHEDARIWVDAPYDVRLARGIARDGEASTATWVDVWMPNEDRYVATDDPIGCADLVVDGTAPLAS